MIDPHLFLDLELDQAPFHLLMWAVLPWAGDDGCWYHECWLAYFETASLLYLIGCVCCTNRSSTLCSLDGSTLCCRWGLLSVVGSGALLGPMWSRISSHFRLTVVVSSWKCSRNWSPAIARGFDAPESTIIVLDSGMVSRLSGLSDVVCVRFSGWAPFDFRATCAAFVQTLWNYCRD